MNSLTFYFMFIHADGTAPTVVTYTPGNPDTTRTMKHFREAANLFPDAFAKFERVVIYSTHLNTSTSYDKQVFDWVLGLAPHPEDPDYMGHPTPAVQE